MPEIILSKNVKIFGFLVTFMVFAGVVFAANDKDVPPWMESVDDGGRSTYLVPKGAKRKVFGSQVIIETPNEYVARRLYEMEGYLDSRFKRIEEAQEELHRQLEALQKEIEHLVEPGRFAADFEDLKSAVEGLKEFKSSTEETLLRLKESGVASEGSQGVIEGIVP